MKKRNIAELLKDCPKGMELDCMVYDNCTFEIVFEGCLYPIQIQTPEGLINLTKYGSVSQNTHSKCIIYPKGKTTWEGFQRPFKDGDIITDSLSTCIFKGECKIKGTVDYYCGISSGCFSVKDNKCRPDIHYGCIVYYRFATEEEKEKLFQAIKENGYSWNPETKTLEKLVEPKFKDGDVLTYTSNYTTTFIYRNKDNEPNFSTSFYVACNNAPSKNFLIYNKYTLIALNGNCDIRLATEEEKEKLFQAIKENGYSWNPETKTLEKLTEPRFKVGNRIRRKDGIEQPVTISSVSAEYYIVQLKEGEGALCVADQDLYELAPDKFDINTLKPFESRVLVRSTNGDIWRPAIYGFTDSDRYFVVGGVYWRQCIPYEGNQHLLGNTYDCDDFYKI